MTIKRYFVPIKDAQIHVRRAGEGPPVILLHPSPQSSTFSIPMVHKLAAAGFTAIAVDLPGYGLSDPLVGGYPQGLSRPHGLDPYLATYVQLLDALSLEKAVFYGNATGAEFSHIFAYNHPERVAVAMLDTAGHNPDEEVDKLTDGYFPDTTPKRDGGHLLTYWDMVRFLSIFAPWQFTDKAHRLPVDQPPADKVHDKLIEYLRAGQNYAEAYRAAFYTAKGDLIGRVKVPATLTRWEGKPNIAEIDALIAYGLPANFTVLRPGPTMDQRLDASVDYLVKNYKTIGKPAPPQPAQIDRAANRLQKIWVDVPGGQLLARVCFAGSGRPILGLHDPAGSSKRLEATLAPFIGKRPVIAIDNPSSGESDKLLSRDQISTEAYARYALAALDALNVKEIDVIGRYSGGQVAMEMSFQRPGLVKHIAQVGVMIFNDTERADLLANYTPSIAPQWDGSHLITAWAIIRDMNLFWPWYNRTKAGVIAKDALIDGPSLHPRVEDLLKMGDAYQNAYAAAFTYPMAEKLGQLTVPCLAADVPGSGTYNRVAMAKAAAPNLKTADLSDDMKGWTAVFEFLLRELTPMATITKHFLPLADGRQIHYRRAGTGPPLIIMHPSPSSSASMTNAINAYAEIFTCLAIDTPGYGLSDDIVDDPTLLWGYADAVATFMDGLGITQTCLYGAATGAQIAIQFARKYPARTALAILDANGDFGGAAGEHVATGYFQDITPVRDGSHLLRIWDMSRHLSVFFPWQSTAKEDRLAVATAPPEIIQHTVNDYLRAGPNYKKAYYAAMVVETWENTRQVTVPVLMMRNSGSVLLPHTDALIAKGLPPNFTILQCDPATRFSVQVAAAKQRLAQLALPTPRPAPDDHTPSANRIQNFYTAARGGQLRIRGSLAGKGRPIVALHDPAGSAHLVEPILRPYLGQRPIIALDLPGNGESDNVIDPTNITSAAYAEIVIEALKSIGVREIDMIGRYSGGPIGLEMSFQNSALIKHLVLAGIGNYIGQERKDLVDNYTPSIAPRWDGAHLVRAWGIMRDQGLFWPWFNRTKAGILWNNNAIDVNMIHLRVMEMLKIGDQYKKAYDAMWTYPMAERLPQVKVPTLLAVPTWEPIYAKNAECAALAPQCRTADLAPGMADWHKVLTPFFDA